MAMVQPHCAGSEKPGELEGVDFSMTARMKPPCGAIRDGHGTELIRYRCVAKRAVVWLMCGAGFAIPTREFRVGFGFPATAQNTADGMAYSCTATAFGGLSKRKEV